MQINLTMDEKEIKSCLNNAQGIMSQDIEIKIGSESFTCKVINYEFKIPQGWDARPTIYTLNLQGYSKREKELREATALVNKTKQEYKEAQRKLSELNGPKTK